jgi:hypothetical protein
VVLMGARGVPTSPRIWSVANSGNNSIAVKWTDDGFVHVAYRIYTSSDGVTFNAPVTLGSSVLSFIDGALTPGLKRYYKVTVVGSGGESPYSRVYGAQVSSDPPILVVDGNDRWQFQTTENPQGTNHAFAAMAEQNIHGPAFDTAYHGAINDGTVQLTNYPAVIWLCGEQSTDDQTFDATAQPLVTAFLNKGGDLFVSGAEIGWDLDRDSGPTAADRNFCHNQLRAAFNGNANDDAGTYVFASAAGGIFTSDTGGAFDNGTYFYNIEFPDVLTATNGSVSAMTYVGGRGGAAAITYDGTPSSGKVVNWGFPFESITNSVTRDVYMSDVLRFFNLLSAPVISSTSSDGTSITLTWSATPGIKYRVQYTTDLNSGSWTTLSPDVTATATTASKTDILGTNPRYYRVLLLN